MKTSKRYKSIYGSESESIRPDQYLVELIIKRRADKQKVVLPPRFWSKKEHSEDYSYWTRIFGSELKHSKPLFKKYAPECIIDAFLSHDCQYVLSCTNKQFEKVVQEFQRRKEMLDAVKQEVVIKTSPTTSLPRKQTGKLNKLSKLK